MDYKRKKGVLASYSSISLPVQCPCVCEGLIGKIRFCGDEINTARYSAIVEQLWMLTVSYEEHLCLASGKTSGKTSGKYLANIWRRLSQVT